MNWICEDLSTEAWLCRCVVEMQDTENKIYEMSNDLIKKTLTEEALLKKTEKIYLEMCLFKVVLSNVSQLARQAGLTMEEAVNNYGNGTYGNCGCRRRKQST